MDLQDFDYPLPKKLVAQKPLRKRDESRLMVLHRNSGQIAHTRFSRLPGYLQEGDLLVANNTRVIPARVYGKKETGGWVELFLLNFLSCETEGKQTWECLLKSRRKINADSRLYFGRHLSADVLAPTGRDTWRVALHYRGSFDEALRKTGGVQIRATELLGINQRSLWHRIKKHGIDVKSMKNNEI